jgi:hypothetical protein
MREFLQAAIPVVLTALLAGQVAITRTGRLRKVIRANVELLDKLPADHPNRARLEAENGELVDLLTWRLHQQFHPLSSPWTFRLAPVLLAVAALGWAALLAAGLTGAFQPESPTALWSVVIIGAVLLATTVVMIRSTAKLDRQHRRLLQQVSEITTPEGSA